MYIYIHTYRYTYIHKHVHTMYIYVEFINIIRILRDPDIVKSLGLSSVKFPIPMVTYKLTSPISTKFFNFNKLVNNLDLDLFLQTQIVYHANVIALLLLINTTNI